MTSTPPIFVCLLWCFLFEVVTAWTSLRGTRPSLVKGWRSGLVVDVNTRRQTTTILSLSSDESAASSSTADNSNHDPQSSSADATTSTTLTHAVRVMKHVMTEEFLTRSPILKPFHAKLCKNVAVKPSEIHGSGLFATRNIAANTIVSFYPAHALGIDNGQAFLSEDTYFATSTSQDYLHCTDQPIFARKSILGNNNTPVYLDVNPSTPTPLPWVSHYINDAASVKTQTEHGVLQYYETSNQHRNCIHIPFGPSPILATITTKKIKKGQELLTTYGGVYWSTGDQVAITPAISREIQQSASSLAASMAKANTLYDPQLQALQEAFDKVWKKDTSTASLGS